MLALQEEDYAVLTLLDAVAAVVGACSMRADREDAVLPAIDDIVDSMNNLFLGKAYPHRTASDFVSLPKPCFITTACSVHADVIGGVGRL